ncbi:MAG TPA: hypothetical protein VFE46_19550 [Pirellulales bacterium]|jgi:hypothetical protein|nr:hypothetical protein [Pirellulales bacterium]
MSDAQNMPNFADDFQHRLERWADGELNADQQRQLLSVLESQPDGWRRCALAFIEAQALRDELRQLTAKKTAAGTSGPAVHLAAPALRHGGFRMSRLNWFALAASVLVAFTLGMAAHGVLPIGSPAGQANNSTIVQATPDAVSPAAAPSNNSTPAANTSPLEVSANDSVVASNSATTNSSKWQSLKVTLPTASGQGEQTVEVPLVAASEDNVQTLLASQQPVLSDTAVQTLESTGHAVEQHRAYYPVQLEDGTQVVLPMDFVEVRDTDGWQ